jgi:hypothetical protein
MKDCAHVPELGGQELRAFSGTKRSANGACGSSVADSKLLPATTRISPKPLRPLPSCANNFTATSPSTQLNTNMARPKTRSKPKAGGHRVKIIKDDEGKELVSVQGHTGQDVPPGKVAEILAAHVSGMPATRIARAFNTSYHTIIALIRNRPEALDKARQTAANNWKTLAAVGTAELLDGRGCRGWPAKGRRIARTGTQAR